MNPQVKKNFHPDLSHPFYFIRKGLYTKIKKFAPRLSGDVLDFGCGAKPYRELFLHCKSYVGVDYDAAGHNHLNEEIDFYYDGKTLPFGNEQFDGIFSSEVFEHLFTMPSILLELNRVMKQNGRLLITCPFVWPEHEKPYDFARYTLFALTTMLNEAGFEVIETDKSGNFFLTVHQLNTLYVDQFICSKFAVKNTFPFMAKLARKTIIPLMNVYGLLGNAIFPKNKDLYLNNILLAQKVKS